MLTKQQEFGEKGESLAVRFLKKKGYKILAQNYRTSLGEIDIIARENNTIVFVEVKSRKSIRFGNPKWAVNSEKQRKISMVALQYLKATQQIGAKARFDVVSVLTNRDDPEISVIKNAFDLAYQ